LFTRLACLAGLSLAVAGCTSTPDPYSPGRDRSVDERKKDFPIDHSAYAKLGYRLDWIGYPAVTGSLPVEHFHPYPDMSVAVEQGSTVTILESSTGARRCADKLATPLTRFVGLVRQGNRVFLAAESEVFTLDTQTCNLVARAASARNVATEPLLAGDLLIFGSGAGEIFASLAGGSVSGIKAWGFMCRGAVEHKPVLIGGIVGAVSQTGDVVFLDAMQGTLLGQNSIYGGLDTDPVSDDRLMFVASLDQSIYAFAPNASKVWRYRTAAPLHDQPTVVGDRLYCNVAGQGLTAFQTGDGAVVWSCKGFGGTVVAVNNNHLVAWNGHEAALIDPARGDIIERTALPGVRMLTPERLVDGNLYAVSNSGVVAKFLPTSKARTEPTATKASR
jgi:hypothetical protein